MLQRQTAIPEQRRGEDESAPASQEIPAKKFTLRAAWPAIALYAALRAIGVLALWLAASDQHRDLWALLGRYDGGWYALIVENGYDQTLQLKPDGSPAPSNLAFFPLYPGLTALADHIVPGGARIAGIPVAWVAGLAAAWGLYALGAHLRDHRTGVMLAALWAVVPHGIVQSMGYTETLFTAFTSWSLFALLRRHWVTAGLLCLLAGLTRPTSAAIVAAVGLAALVAVFRRQDSWRPWVAGMLAPLGLLGFMAWVGHRLGRADGYFHVQNDTWNISYDGGVHTVQTMYSLLITSEHLPAALWINSLILLISLALLVILAFDRVPWPLVVFAGAILGMSYLGDAYFHTAARHLMPAFPLLLPIAFALAGTRRHVRVVVLTLLTVISAGYGVFLSIAATHSP